MTDSQAIERREQGDPLSRKRWVIEIENVIRLSGGHLRMARIWQWEERWPTKSRRPWVSLVAGDDASLTKAIKVWIDQGRPTMDELKAQDTGTNA